MYNVPCQRSGKPGVSLPTSSHLLLHSTPLSGDTRVFARYGGTLVAPTAHACPGTRLVCVASGIHAWRALRTGGALGGPLCPSTPPPTGRKRKRREGAV